MATWRKERLKGKHLQKIVQKMETLFDFLKSPCVSASVLESVSKYIRSFARLKNNIQP
jgi:hypothetical protein